jgi:hypothetical protein
LTEEFTFTFPDNTTCKTVLLKFVFKHGGGTAHSSQIALQQYEIEYALEPSDLKVYDFVVLADDNIEIENMQQENSGRFIAKTLYSCAVSPRTFILEMPWPTQHTVRGLVQISSPGGAPPGFAYDPVRFDGGDIPVHIDEM